MSKRINNYLITLTIFSTLFISSGYLIDKETLPKWYALIACAVLGVVLSVISVKKIKFDGLTIAVVALVSYLILRSAFPHFDVFRLLCLFSFLLLFFLFQSLNGHYTVFTTYVIAIATILQGVYGLLQFTNVLHFHSNFPILGSYDNPAGFSVCLAAGLPFCLAIPKNGKVSLILKISAAVVLWVSIILSGSRAGIFAAGTVTLIYFGKKYWFIIARKRLLVLSILALVLIAVSVGLFAIKKDSATGRLLIWKISADMITEAPIFGFGSSAFQSQYMLYQARYFEDHPDSRFVMLADNVIHPFNEYLMLTIEYGIFGLLILAIVVYCVFMRIQNIANPVFLCLVAVGIFSCFSYPFKYAYIVVLCAYCLSVCCSQTRGFKIGWTLKGTILVLALFIGWLVIQDFVFEYRWKKLVNRATFGKMAVIEEDYASLYNHWKGNPFFLYNYGAELRAIGHYTESMDVLIKCESRFNNYDVQMIIADNYYHLHNYDFAIIRYILAHNMIPCRFLPLYKLMLLYYDMGHMAKAGEIAQVILDKKIKIESASVVMMKMKAKELLDLFAGHY